MWYVLPNTAMLAKQVPTTVLVLVVLGDRLLFGLYSSNGSVGCVIVLVPDANARSASLAIEPFVCPSDVISLVSTHLSLRNTPDVSLSFNHKRCVMNDFSAGGLSCAVDSVDTRLCASVHTSSS